jgi:hypothetical protein
LASADNSVDLGRPLPISRSGFWQEALEDSPIGHFDIEVLRVVAGSQPPQGRSIVGMAGIAENLDLLPMAPGAAAVFLRASPSALDDARVVPSFYLGHHVLEHDRVQPAIAEVVNVFEPVPAFAQEVADFGFVLVMAEVVPLGFRYPVELALLPELD